jgi:hypothetical protein
VTPYPVPCYSILAKKSRHTGCIIREVTEVKLHLENMNREEVSLRVKIVTAN